MDHFLVRITNGVADGNVLNFTFKCIKSQLENQHFGEANMSKTKWKMINLFGRIKNSRWSISVYKFVEAVIRIRRVGFVLFDITFDDFTVLAFWLMHWSA